MLRQKSHKHKWHNTLQDEYIVLCLNEKRHKITISFKFFEVKQGFGIW